MKNDDQHMPPGQKSGKLSTPDIKAWKSYHIFYVITHPWPNFNGGSDNVVEAGKER